MPVLKLGSSGTEVTSLQQRLKELGFDPNGVDGNFGGGTQAAVIAFQRANKLEPDGKVGPGTAAALGLNNGAGSTSGATSDTTVQPRFVMPCPKNAIDMIRITTPLLPIGT